MALFAWVICALVLACSPGNRETAGKQADTPTADQARAPTYAGELTQDEYMAAALPVTKVRVRELNALDEVRWFSERMNKLPTCRAVAEHARNIYETDFRFPIILSPSGVVLDGMHRLCKAFLEGMEEIDVVQLPTMPPFRWRMLPSGEEVEFAADASEIL